MNTFLLSPDLTEIKATRLRWACYIQRMNKCDIVKRIRGKIDNLKIDDWMEYLHDIRVVEIRN